MAQPAQGSPPHLHFYSNIEAQAPLWKPRPPQSIAWKKIKAG